MFKRTKLTLISTLLYGVFTLGGVGTAIYMKMLIDQSSKDSAAGFEALGYAIFMIFALGYAVVGLLPFILHLIDLFKNSKPLCAVCIPFDLAFLGFNGFCLYSVVSDMSADAAITLAVTALLLIASLAILITDIASLKCGYDD